jgi:hypothetical protein
MFCFLSSNTSGNQSKSIFPAAEKKKNFIFFTSIKEFFFFLIYMIDNHTYEKGHLADRKFLVIFNFNEYNSF